MTQIEELQKLILNFAKERDWEKYHTPKNLALALGSEVGELLAEFRWKNDEELNNLDIISKERIELELADSLIFLLRLAQILNIDIDAGLRRKLALNANRTQNGANLRKK